MMRLMGKNDDQFMTVVSQMEISVRSKLWTAFLLYLRQGLNAVMADCVLSMNLQKKSASTPNISIEVMMSMTSMMDRSQGQEVSADSAMRERRKRRRKVSRSRASQVMAVRLSLNSERETRRQLVPYSISMRSLQRSQRKKWLPCASVDIGVRRTHQRRQRKWESSRPPRQLHRLLVQERGTGYRQMRQILSWEMGITEREASIFWILDIGVGQLIQLI